MKQGILIPVYRHGSTAIPLAENLAALGPPVILVDDGNDEETRASLAECAANTPGIVLVSLKKNTGKGGATIRGFEKAAELGLSHILMIDADGQHDAGKVEFFLAESAGHPEQVICGLPEFDETAPRSRVMGRKISNFWATIVTLSDEFKDLHCGLRVYPVEPSLKIMKHPFMEKRMGFDTEILIRLYWNRVFPVFYPVKVSYPPDGISNFRMVRDNIGISWTFSRLFVGMLFRLPLLIALRIQRRKEAPLVKAPYLEAQSHWSRHKEQAAGYWHVKLLLVSFRIFPVIILRVLAFPVGFIYFLFSKKGRIESRRFLQKAAPFIEEPGTAKKCRSPLGPLRHIVSFSLSLVEKLQSWGGKFYFKDIHFQNDDIEGFTRGLEKGNGTFLICSHLGNMELLRGLANLGRTGLSRKIPVTSIIDVDVTAHFSRILKELNPQAGLDIISAKEISPQTAILLEEKLAAGELVVIAGDRTAAEGDKKNIMIPFLGKEAPFSSGVFYLAALLKAPVYFVFVLRRGDLSLKPEYDIHVHKSPLSFDCARKERIVRSSLLAHSFAALLESYCKKQPFQWYNFYNFWQEEV
ncbi:MAG: glycosyltransferase family 2 protein [Treponema sp.]|jgi:predicted LPLAT superfamily acyltransferase|nr:glycosyltransferase family 2 protein [Treponema sp.]